MSEADPPEFRCRGGVETPVASEVGRQIGEGRRDGGFPFGYLLGGLGRPRFGGLPACIGSQHVITPVHAASGKRQLDAQLLASEQEKNCKIEISGAARPATPSDYPEEGFNADTLRARLDLLTNPLLVQILDAACYVRVTVRFPEILQGCGIEMRLS